jgi:hypothetical protein
MLLEFPDFFTELHIYVKLFLKANYICQNIKTYPIFKTKQEKNQN